MAKDATKSSSSSLLDWFLLVVNILAFIAMVFFNIASVVKLKGLFDNTADEISNAVPIDITPDGWTFSTWAIIYTWQALWLLLNLALMVVSDDHGFKLYKNPRVFNRQFHLFMCANFLLNISWLFVWDAGHFGISFGVILLMAGTVYMSTIIVHHNTTRAAKQLKNRPLARIGYRLFANNGLACYATWLTVATTVNLAIAWTYEWSSESARDSIKVTSSIFALSIISIIVIIYFVLDLFVFEKHMRYTFSTYLELEYALAGILTKNWTSSNQTESAIFALVLACVVGVMFIFKVFYSFKMHAVHAKEN